jgi:hypothetical protein
MRSATGSLQFVRDQCSQAESSRRGRSICKAQAVSTEEAAKILPRAEFSVFGHGVIKTVQEKMWGVGAILGMARKMPMELYLVSVHTDSANAKVREVYSHCHPRSCLTSASLH